MIYGNAIFERVRAAGIGCDVATDGARPLTRRVRYIVITELLEMIRYVKVDDAGADDGVTIAQIHLVNLLEARESNQHAASHGQTTPRQAGACAARYERKIEFIAEFDYAGNVFG